MSERWTSSRALMVVRAFAAVVAHVQCRLDRTLAVVLVAQVARAPFGVHVVHQCLLVIVSSSGGNGGTSGERPGVPALPGDEPSDGSHRRGMLPRWGSLFAESQSRGGSSRPYAELRGEGGLTCEVEPRRGE